MLIETLVLFYGMKCCLILESKIKPIEIFNLNCCNFSSLKDCIIKLNLLNRPWNKDCDSYFGDKDSASQRTMEFIQIHTSNK